MSNTDSSEEKDEESRKDPSIPSRGPWRLVDPRIWARRAEEPQGFLSGVVARWLERIAGMFSSAVFLVLLLAPVGGISAYLTFYVAYSLGGSQYFGAYFVGIWSVVVVGAVVVLERSGYARNFEGWDFSLRKVVFLPLGFLLALGMLLLLFLLGGAIHL